MTFKDLFEKFLESDLDFDAEIRVISDIPFASDDPVTDSLFSKNANVIILKY